MGTKIIYSTRRKRNVKHISLRNRKENISSEQFRLSNLTFENEHLCEEHIKSFLPLLYKGLLSKYPTMSEIEIKENTTSSILKGIEAFLSDNFNFNDINFSTFEGKKTIHIYKEFEYTDYTVWFIFFKKVLSIKSKNPALYKILTGFISSLPYLHNEILEESLEQLDAQLEDKEALDEDEYKVLKKIKKNTSKMNDTFKKGETFNWGEDLKKYFPKKSIQKRLKTLLLTSFDINFRLPHNFVAMKMIDLNNGSRNVNFADLFSVLYDDDTFTNNYVLGTININGGEFGMTPPLDEIIINEKGVIISDFSIEQKELNKLLDFLTEFIELLNQLN